MQPTHRAYRSVQRGTSIIEGLVVLAVLALLLALGIRFFRKYDGAVNRAMEARAAAWGAAIAGCERNPRLRDDFAEVLRRPASIGPRAAVSVWKELTLDGAPELVVRELGSEAAVVVPCNELPKVTGAPMNQLQEPL